VRSGPRKPACANQWLAASMSGSRLSSLSSNIRPSAHKAAAHTPRLSEASCGACGAVRAGEAITGAVARSRASSSANHPDLKSHHGIDENKASNPAPRKAVNDSGVRPGAQAISCAAGRPRRAAAASACHAAEGRHCGD